MSTTGLVVQWVLVLVLIVALEEPVRILLRRWFGDSLRRLHHPVVRIGSTERRRGKLFLGPGPGDVGLGGPVRATDGSHPRILPRSGDPDRATPVLPP